MKRLISMVLSVVICLSFSGCNYLLGESDNLLQAPKPDETLQEIQKALKSADIPDGYTLKAAKSGNYRSAYVVKDINGNGENEAVVFYAEHDGNEETLHLSLLQYEGNDWKVTASTHLGGTNLERVDFGDFNGDGTDELVVAWNIYGAPETRLSVFRINDLKLKGVFEERYTDFCIYDMNTDGRDDLMVFTIDTIEKISQCSMYVEDAAGFVKQSVVDTDKNAIGFKSIRKSAVDGKPALFVDCTLLEGGLFTELITLGAKGLRAPLYAQSGQSSLITKRSQNILCGDANGDGVVEIPCGTVLPSGDDVQSALDLIEWKQYSSGELLLKERSIVSGARQYKFIISDGWLGSFAAATSENDGIDIYEYRDKARGKLVLSLKAVSTENYDADSFKDWYVINQNYKTVYIAKITEKQSKLGTIDKKTVKKYWEEKIVEEG